MGRGRGGKRLLLFPLSGDDYDVFGLWRPLPQIGELMGVVWVWLIRSSLSLSLSLSTVEPVKKSHQKSSMKKMKYVWVKRS